MFERSTPLANTGLSTAPHYTTPTLEKPTDAPPSSTEVGGIIVEGRRMEKSLAMLHEEISYLESALGLVVKPPEPDSNAGTTGTQAPIRSTLADGLADANRLIDSAIRRMSLLRARVDL